MVTRRSLLARCGRLTAVGALLGVAGCVDRSSSGSGSRPTESSPTPTPTATTETARGSAPGRPDFGGFLDDANLFDGAVADESGRAAVTVRVGASEHGYAFDPPAIHVDTGTTVRWTWTGNGGAHDVVSVADDPLDSGSPVGGTGVHYEYTFTDDGVFNYHCVPHRALGMKGSVVVGTDYPTRSASTASEAPDEPDHFLADANGYDGGTATDRTGRDAVTVVVGAGERGYAFDPVAVAVDPGTTVQWVWAGRGGPHNVVARDGSFDSGAVEEGEGVTFEYTVTDPGSHRYTCLPHEALGMKGVIAVGPERDGDESETEPTVVTAGDDGDA